MRDLKIRLTPSLLASPLLTVLLASSSLAQQTAPAPVPAVQQHQKVQPPSPQERCEALKLRLLKDAYDWQIYAQIGDTQMEMNHPREAAASYEKAIAIYPITRERGAEMRQAEFLAAQANAEQQRQKIARESAQKQAQSVDLRPR